MPKPWLKRLLLISLGALLLALSSLRNIGNYGVETDFYGGFVPEAQRLLAGEPLDMSWQPPFYSLVLAGLYSLTGDWFRPALLVSVLAAVLAVSASFQLFRSLFDEAAAWGAAIGLVLWAEFARLSISASADMLFLSLLMTSMALSAQPNPAMRCCFVAGFLSGLASLTRTNGISFLLISLMCASQPPAGRRKNVVGLFAVGFLLPWVAWLLFSKTTGSPLLPTRTHVGPAVMLFGPQGATSQNSDNWASVEERFSSLLDVILFDPTTFFHATLVNLGTNIFSVFEVWGKLAIPVGTISLLGIGWLVAMSRTPLCFGFWLVYLAQYGLLALISIQPRYFLFLVPVFSAGAFSLGARVLLAVGGGLAQDARVRALAVALGLLPLLAFDARTIVRFFRSEPTEVLEAADVLALESSGVETVIARKPHLAFYSGLPGIGFPLVDTTEELLARLCVDPPRERGFLFFGEAEAQMRPALRSLRDPEEAPPWLRPIGHGDPTRSSWALYEVRCSQPTGGASAESVDPGDQDSGGDSSVSSPGRNLSR